MLLDIISTHRDSVTVTIGTETYLTDTLSLLEYQVHLLSTECVRSI